MINRFIIFCCLAVLFSLNLNGQDKFEKCGSTMQAHQQMMKDNPAYKKHVFEWERKIAPILKQRRENRNPTCTNGPIMVQVAVHFDSGLVNANDEACAITIVQEQIEEVNREVTGMDSDAGLINNFTSCFGADILGDACIEFCLATQNHPAGFGLNDGDPAITFGALNFNVTGSNFTPVNPAWAGYVNIYVDNLRGGLLGVSNGIPGSFNGDGVLVDNCVFGTGNLTCSGVNTTGAGNCGGSVYDEGETLVHELGHYFGLYHIWGDNSNCNGTQDRIDDTPDMTNNYSGYTSCNDNNCSDLPTACGSEDMYMNFMSYASDGCMYMFTSDQSDVMYATAVAQGYTTSNSFCESSPPVAEFRPTGNITVCELDCIEFIDLSDNSPTSWSWTFSVISGNLVLDINSSTDQNPEICVTGGTGGTISVELTATNSAGDDTTTNDLVVTLLPASTYWLDEDGDGFGGSTSSIQSCAPVSGYSTLNTDCDDDNSNIYPGGLEICDGVDNDCDGQIDEGISETTYYADTDRDGFGNPNNTVTGCRPPSGYVLDNTDCDDNDANNFPGNREICDGQDNNCDGVVDEGCSNGTNCDGDYLVINNITQNIYRAEINVKSTATVNNGASVLYTAGTDIDLEPGFEVILGTDFEARIQPCDNGNPSPESMGNNNGNSTNYQDVIEALSQKLNGLVTEIKIVKFQSGTEEGLTLVTLTDNLEQITTKLSTLPQGTYKVYVYADKESAVEKILVIK